MVKKENKEINTSIEEDIRYTDVKKESDFSKVSELLLNEKYKRRKTILNNKQITLITTLDVAGQLYDIEFINLWVSDYAEWRTSGDGGKGRKDIVDIAKFKHMEEKELQKELVQLMRGN